MVRSQSNQGVKRMRDLGTRLQTWLLILGLALLLALALPSVAQLNAVYVQSNISSAGQNSVLGFSIDTQGNLTPLPGSPYQTGGTGWAVPDGELLGFQADA